MWITVTPDLHTNEHQDAGRYEDCIVAFLDILGFKSKVLDSQNNVGTLENILQSLKIVSAIPSGGKKVSSHLGGQRTIQIRSRFFSDLLVFFLKENPEDIAQLFFVIRYLQDQLWQRDICLRGSIVRGQMYWTENDDNVTVGQGLIDAHHREATMAIYPRIVVSGELYKYIEHNRIRPYPFGTQESVGLAEFIIRDSDGVRFLDLLNPGIIRRAGEYLDTHLVNGHFTIWYNPDAESRRPEVMNHVDRIIRENTDAADEKIRQKYAWLQTYRNRYDG